MKYIIVILPIFISAISAQGGGGCMNRGQCLGVLTISLPTDMITDCFEVCQEDYECVAFSYNYGTGECQNYETFEEVN